MRPINIGVIIKFYPVDIGVDSNSGACMNEWLEHPVEPLRGSRFLWILSTADFIRGY